MASARASQWSKGNSNGTDQPLQTHWDRLCWTGPLCVEASTRKESHDVKCIDIHLR